MEIIPSIFTTDEQTFSEQLSLMNTAPINSVHIDITDGTFVPTQTFSSPAITENILQLGCELHLMVTEPLKILPLWHNVPNVTRVFFHCESNDPITTVIEAIQAQGWEAGLVLNPTTPWDTVTPYLENLDALMFMGVTPGAQGRTLIPEVLEKAYSFKQKHPQILTAWDGDVTIETLPYIMNTGVDSVCPGHAIFASGDPVENVVELQNII